MAVNTDSILQAIDIVATSRVKKYQYDETIEAKIVSTSRRSEGIYKVEYENGKFDAYSSDTQTFYENEVVYVMIPKGDYTKQKYIIGRKVDESSDSASYNFNFKLPFDNFVGLENLTYGVDVGTKGYLANHPNHGVTTAEVLTNVDGTNLIWSWSRDDDNPVIETKLGIAADWKVLLGKYNMKKGTYGLRVDVTGMTKSVEGENSKEKTTTYYFTNNDMYGNSYAFYEPTQQQIIFDISEYLTLNQITICFYQDHRFIDVYNNKVPYQDPVDNDPNKNNLPVNIQVSDLQVLLGLTTDECQTDRVFLYTYDDMYYGYDPLGQLDEYLEYHNKYTNIQSSGMTEQQKQAALTALVAEYSSRPGYEWLKPNRTLKFAWVHLDDNGNPVLVNHYYKRNDQDTAAFEYWADAVDAQLHWYHYEYACAQNNDNLYERQGGVNWKYLETTAPTNEEDAENYNNYVVTPDATRARDQWKALVSVNNVPYTTEPLIFTNVDTTVETAAFDTLNEITLRFLREETTVNEETGESVTNIIEDNSLRDFYVYDENNRITKDKDNVSYADRWYYVQVWLRNNDTGDYLPLIYDPDQGEAKVYWNFESTAADGTVTLMQPQKSMIREWAKPTAAELSQAVLAPTLDGANPIYNNQILAITRKFKIRDYWDLAYLNNTISAVVQRRTKTYHPAMELHFGQAGSMGSEYTISIVQLSPEGQYMIKDQEFQLAAYVIKKGESIASSANSKYTFTWHCISPTIITRSAQEDASTFKQEWTITNGTTTDYYGFIGNVINGYIRNDEPPIFKVTVMNAADYTIAATIGFRLITDATAASEYTTNCPTRVEFKSDGSVPLALTSTFSVFRFVDGVESEVYPEWTLEQSYKDYDGNYYESNNYLALATEVTYDQAVATSTNPLIYYATDSSGNIDLDSAFTSAATTTNTKCMSYVNLERKIQDAYDSTLQALTGSEANLIDIQQTAETLKQQREMNLAIAATKIIPGYTRYKLDPYIRNTTNTSDWYWEEAMINYYSVLQWEYTDGTGKTVTCRQALPFTRNLYSSSLLNSWDGKLTIDENENAILAQMISAGVKNSNNTFTGVVMGNWAERADSSLDIPGLYGIKDGAQVFGFKTDGTGFIGASGRGQIQFDGNQSLISNVDKTMYLNLDPRTYDYTSGEFKINDYYGYSPYFLYAETTKSSTASLIGEDDFEESTAWANKFMNDIGKDYFIVDPNNGVLTTGGIIARYGKIGNWSISSAGLYQKFTGDTTTNSRYMYLGYPSAVAEDNAQALKQINIDYDVQLVRVKSREDAELELAYTNYMNARIIFLGKYYKPIFQYDPIHYFNYGWVFKDIYLAAEEALRIYSVDHNTSLQETLEAALMYYINNDPHVRVHAHFNSDGTVQYHYQRTGWYLPTLIRNITGTNSAPNTACVYNPETHSYTIDPAYANNAGGENIVSGFREYAYATSTVPVYSSYNYFWYNGDEAWNWNNTYRQYGATSNVLGTFSTNTVTASELQSMIPNWKAWYNYTYKGYELQLEQMLDAGLAYLRQTSEYSVYLEYMRTLKENYDKTVAKIKTDYNNLRKNLATSNQKRIDKLVDTDKDRYAIFAGYTPTSVPLFSVNWRGYMTVRAGKIGEKSPWYISDEGLTQKNNSGTIFLGNPDSKSNGSGWTDLGLSNDMDNLSDILLPNDPDGALAGPLVLGASDTTATRGRFAIYAGNKGYIWDYNKNTQQYSRKAEDSASIKFGVRMDGTLYAQSGLVGGWQLAHNMLYAGEPDSGDFIVLDANRGVINLNNAVVLSKTGEVILGVFQEGVGTVGDIYIAGFQFLGKTSEAISYKVPNYTFTNTDQTLLSDSDNISYWGGKIKYTDVTVTSTSIADANATITKKMTPTGLLEIKHKNETTAGMVLASGKDTNNQEVIALYPTTENSVLGTTGNRWDIIGDTIICNSLDITQGNINAKRMFMENELVATETWVKDQLVAVYNAIKTTGGGSSGVGGRAYGGAGNLASGINKLYQIIDIITEPSFVTNIKKYDKGYLYFDGVEFKTEWEDIKIGAGEDGVDSGGTGEGSTEDVEIEGKVYLTGANIHMGVAFPITLWEGISATNPSASDFTFAITDNNLTWAASHEGVGPTSVTGWKWSATNMVSLSHTHKPEFTEPSGASGTVKLTIGDADFSKTTSEEATFDVVNTSWFKSLLLKQTDNTTNEEATIEISSSNTTISNTTTNKITVYLTESTTDKKVVLRSKRDNSQMATISTQSTYAAGWNDACGKMGWGTAGANPRTITYPTTTTPGTSTSTKTVTASVSGGGGGGGYSSISIGTSQPTGYSSNKHTITESDVGKNIYCSHVSGGSAGSATLSIT